MRATGCSEPEAGIGPQRYRQMLWVDPQDRDVSRRLI